MNSKIFKISCIIPTYNSAKTISSCLDTLLNQSLSSEIIVVDDGSTDDTVQVLKDYKNKITLLTQDHKGPAVARNYASSEASGNILVFADSDMTFGKNYLKDLTRPIKEGNAIGTYTINERVLNWGNIWAKCWNIQEGWDPRLRFNKKNHNATDYRAILKNKFEEVGGFDDIGYTDSWSLFKKLSTRPAQTNALCYHKNPDNLKSVFRHASWVSRRPYKLGLVGISIALIRASLPVSVVIGVAKSIKHLTPHFMIFKLVYDLGITLGLLSMLTTGKKSK